MEANRTAPRRVVLMDRDGTINVDKHYLGDPDHLELVPGAGPALQRLVNLGFALVVVTNQSGVGHGKFGLDAVGRVHARLAELLAEFDVRLDGIYICPHTAADECACRKPKTLLVERAQADLHIDPAGGYMIGDKAADVRLGQNVGATTFLVRTGYGAGVEQAGEVFPDYTVDALPQAVDIIVAREAEQAATR